MSERSERINEQRFFVPHASAERPMTPATTQRSEAVV
jgi:hypothetical protein